MVTGVVQAGSSLGILVPPSVVLVLYAMIARQPVGQLWLAGMLAGADDGRDVRGSTSGMRCRLNAGAWADAVCADDLDEVTTGPRNCRLLWAGAPAARHLLPR